MKHLPSDPLDDLEVCINFWWFVNKDVNLVTHWAARYYSLTGTDEEKLNILHSLTASDYASVPRHPVSDRHVTHMSDARVWRGAIPFTDDFRNDLNRFEEILLSLERSLPTHKSLIFEGEDKSMAFGEPFISIETIIEYDSERVLGPVITHSNRPKYAQEIFINPWPCFHPIRSASDEEMWTAKGLLVTFSTIRLVSYFGKKYMSYLRAAVVHALAIEASLDKILVAVSETSSSIVLAFGYDDRDEPKKAITILTETPGFIDSFEQSFPIAIFRPFALWKFGTATALPESAVFGEWS